MCKDVPFGKLLCSTPGMIMVGVIILSTVCCKIMYIHTYIGAMITNCYAIRVIKWYYNNGVVNE